MDVDYEIEVLQQVYQNKTEYEHTNNLFDKHFTITNGECYPIPAPTNMFTDPPWVIKELQQFKEDLNKVKNRLNDYDLDQWQSHTKLWNKAKDVLPQLKSNIRPELLTYAWCKFYELVSNYPLVPVDHISYNKCFQSIHLCEAPGAFVTSLNHWIKTNVPNIPWTWLAMTLNPYYDGHSGFIMVDDDRFIRHTIDHWCFGEDNTGNIMNYKNLNRLIKLTTPNCNTFLVTADGSMDCTDVPAEQESVLIHLHFCETVAALQLLPPGGSFLLKIFTIFECNTVCLIYLLSCCFNNVTVTKPATSKEGNSETYVVCTDFKGSTFISPHIEKLKEYYECGPKQAIFKKQDIPLTFIKMIVECSRFFQTQQTQAILSNILAHKYKLHLDKYKPHFYRYQSKIKRVQRMVADKYIKDYNLKQVDEVIVGNTAILEKTTNVNQYKRSLQGSYTERCLKHCLGPLERIESFYNDLNKIEIPVLPKATEKGKYLTLPEELEIRTGKMFHTICNSKFCNKLALKTQNGVNDILTELNQKVQFPPKRSIDKLKSKILFKPMHKVLIFLYTDIYDGHKMITKIYEKFQEPTIGESLVLIGYSLLTHLSMELLYILSCTFVTVKVTVCKDMGLIITLDDYYYNPKIIRFIHQIKLASCEAEKEGKAILEIVPPLFLYRAFDFCCYAPDYNHWIIKTYIEYVLSTLKRIEVK